MKVLITGGSGFLGNYLIEHLHKKELNQIITLDWTNNPIKKDYVQSICADIRDKWAVRYAMIDCDVVIHTATANPAYKKNEISSIIIDGTINLLEVCLLNRIKRFIYLSSTAVYGIPQKVPLRENDDTMPYDSYNKAKIDCERICREYRKKGVCIPILRPRTFIGPGRLGIFTILYEWAKEGRNFPMLGSGGNLYQLLDVEDLCEAIYLCMTKDRSIVNDTFNIGAKEFSTIREDYQSILDEAGYGKKIISFPRKPLLIVLKLMEMLKIIPLYRRLYMKLFLDYYVSIEKAEKKLEFKPRYSNKESLLRSFRWYMDNHNQYSNKIGLTSSEPWNQGILKLIKVFF